MVCAFRCWLRIWARSSGVNVPCRCVCGGDGLGTERPSLPHTIRNSSHITVLAAILTVPVAQPADTTSFSMERGLWILLRSPASGCWTAANLLLTVHRHSRASSTASVTLVPPSTFLHSSGRTWTNMDEPTQMFTLDFHNVLIRSQALEPSAGTRALKDRWQLLGNQTAGNRSQTVSGCRFNVKPCDSHYYSREITAIVWRGVSVINVMGTG